MKIKSTDTHVPDNEDSIGIYAETIAAYAAGSVSLNEALPVLSFHGVYPQRDNAAFMLRIRVPAGVLTHAQLRSIAACARAFGNGSLHLTTRQDIQLHDLRLEDTPDIMHEVTKMCLSTRAGGGDGIRNVIAPVLSGLLSSDVFDVIPYARSLTTRLLAAHTNAHLPRKCKIACVPSMRYSDIAYTNDICFVAEIRDKTRGFAVYCGGGLGARPRRGELLYEWIPATECVRIAEAIIRVFDAHGDRNNRAKARFRFVCERSGIKNIRKAVDKEYVALKTNALFDCDLQIHFDAIASSHNTTMTERFDAEIFTDTDGANVRLYPQKDPAYVALPLAVPNGIISADAVDALVEIASSIDYTEDVRISSEQNMLLPNVPRTALPALCAALQSKQYAQLRTIEPLTVVACTGADTCRLGICETRSVANAIRELCSRTAVPKNAHLTPFSIRISGCPNTCSLHLLAPIGFSGKRITRDGVKLEVFTLFLRTDSASFAEKTKIVVAADDLPLVVAALYSDYITCARKGESCVSYNARRGIAYFLTLCSCFSYTSS